MLVAKVESVTSLSLQTNPSTLYLHSKTLLFWLTREMGKKKEIWSGKKLNC